MQGQRCTSGSQRNISVDANICGIEERSSSREARWQEGKTMNPRGPLTRCLLEYRFPRPFRFPRRLHSVARRDIWCRPLPQSRVPSAISSALKPLQLQTPTVSSPLLSNTSSFPLFPSLSADLVLPVPTAHLYSLAPPHHVSIHSFPRFTLFLNAVHSLFPSLRFPPLVFPTPFPFTFGRRYRKSNFVTGTASTRPGFRPLFRRNYTSLGATATKDFPYQATLPKSVLFFSPCFATFASIRP